MRLTVRTLRTDGTVTTTMESAPRYRLRGNALAVIGSRLRAADPTVAACRADEITKAGEVPSYTWVGHYDTAQIDAIVAIERNGNGNNW